MQRNTKYNKEEIKHDIRNMLLSRESRASIVQALSKKYSISIRLVDRFLAQVYEERANFYLAEHNDRLVEDLDLMYARRDLAATDRTFLDYQKEINDMLKRKVTKTEITGKDGESLFANIKVIIENAGTGKQD
jgi:hypothetical protein